MIYRIGYQKLNEKGLVEILKAHRIEVLLDVRSQPYGRVAVFNRKAMERWLPASRDRIPTEGAGSGRVCAHHRAGYPMAGRLRQRADCGHYMPEKGHRKREIAGRLEAYKACAEHIRTSR